MKSNKLTLALAVLLCLGAAWILSRQFSSPNVNLKSSTAAGEVLADEVGRLLGGSGKVVGGQPGGIERCA